MDLSVFRSLRHRNYRLFFAGQFISVTGTWLQLTAMPWLVYRLTDSAFLLGMIGFLSQISILVLSPLAGAVADHTDKKRLIIATQILSMVQAFLLAWLALSGAIRLWHMIILAITLGIVNAFDMTARQSFVIEMVPKEDLMNAIGLNSLIFNGARLIGPAIAGIIIAAWGEGVCFLLNGFSFFAVIAALVAIRPFLRGAISSGDCTITQKMAAGYSYIRQSKRIGPILLLLSITGLVGMFPMTLMPVFVKEIFHRDASGLGLLMSSMGVGALAGTLVVASRKNMKGMERTIFYAAVNIGIAVIAFSFIRNMAAACALIAVAGYYIVTQMALSNTLIQMTTPDDIRGRVMGFFIMAFMGFAPLGSIAAGSMAHALGTPATVGLGGIISLGAAFILRKRILAHA